MVRRFFFSLVIFRYRLTMNFQFNITTSSLSRCSKMSVTPLPDMPYSSAADNVEHTHRTHFVWTPRVVCKEH